jgi:hypothetical protein
VRQEGGCASPQACCLHRPIHSPAPLSAHLCQLPNLPPQPLLPCCRQLLRVHQLALPPPQVGEQLQGWRGVGGGVRWEEFACVCWVGWGGCGGQKATTGEIQTVAFCSNIAGLPFSKCQP